MHPLIGLTKNILVSNVSELKNPYKITHILTYRCQFKCTMCNIWERKPSQELTAGQIAEFYKRSSGLSWINLSGGEIFLRADLLEIIRAIDKYCRSAYLLNFPTNGYQTEVIVDTVREIISSSSFPRVMVTVSLDGPPELHDRIRNMPGSWDRAVETYERLRMLKNARFNVYFGMTLQNANAQAFEETVLSVRQRIGHIQYRDFHVNVLHTSGHYYGNADCCGLRDEQQVINELKRIRKLRGAGLFDPVGFLESQYQKMAIQYLMNKKIPVKCQALAASFFMDPAGLVYPCSVFDDPVGNIKDFGFDLHTLWNSFQRSSARQEIRKGNCPHCWTPCEAYQNILGNLMLFFRR